MIEPRQDRNADLSLICRVQERLCALPLAHVVEVMRALPVAAVAGAPPFVRGLAAIRGALVPVLDAARLLGLHSDTTARFVALAVGQRRVALAVDGVLGLREIPAGSLRELPPLLREAGADVVQAIGLLDSELLLVLRSTRLLPDEAWAAAATAEAAA